MLGSGKGRVCLPAARQHAAARAGRIHLVVRRLRGAQGGQERQRLLLLPPPLGCGAGRRGRVQARRRGPDQGAPERAVRPGQGAGWRCGKWVFPSQRITALGQSPSVLHGHVSHWNACALSSSLCQGCRSRLGSWLALNCRPPRTPRSSAEPPFPGATTAASDC